MLAKLEAGGELVQLTPSPEGDHVSMLQER